MSYAIALWLTFSLPYGSLSLDSLGNFPLALYAFLLVIFHLYLDMAYMWLAVVLDSNVLQSAISISDRSL